MDRISVNSSQIRSIGYDKQSLVLEVEFVSGNIYQYFNVQDFLYQQFLHASSYGEFLNDNIRYNYRYKKIS